jgi:hypothetical protein
MVLSRFLSLKDSNDGPHEPVDTTTRELFKGNFSLSTYDFVQEFLLNAFRKSDFVTNFATTGMVFILTRSIVLSPDTGK